MTYPRNYKPGEVQTGVNGTISTFVDEKDFGAVRLRLVRVQYGVDGIGEWRVVYSNGYGEGPKNIKHFACYFGTETEARDRYEYFAQKIAAWIITSSLPSEGNIVLHRDWLPKPEGNTT